MRFLKSTALHFNVFEAIVHHSMNAFDATPTVLCPFLTQGLHFRMCDVIDASTLNSKTPLPRHALSQGKITDRFIARKMLSAGARDDARNQSRWNNRDKL